MLFLTRALEMGPQSLTLSLFRINPVASSRPVTVFFQFYVFTDVFLAVVLPFSRSSTLGKLVMV